MGPDGGRRPLRREWIVGGAAPPTVPSPSLQRRDPLGFSDPSRDLRSKQCSRGEKMCPLATRACVPDPAWMQAAGPSHYSLRPLCRALAGVGSRRPWRRVPPHDPETGETCAHLQGWTRFFVECVNHGLKTTVTHPKPTLCRLAHRNTRRRTGRETDTRCSACKETSLAQRCTSSHEKPFLVQNERKPKTF